VKVGGCAVVKIVLLAGVLPTISPNLFNTNQSVCCSVCRVFFSHRNWSIFESVRKQKKLLVCSYRNLLFRRLLFVDHKWKSHTLMFVFWNRVELSLMVGRVKVYQIELIILLLYAHIKNTRILTYKFYYCTKLPMLPFVTRYICLVHFQWIIVGVRIWRKRLRKNGTFLHSHSSYHCVGHFGEIRWILWWLETKFDSKYR